MKRVLLIIVSFLFCTIAYAKSTYTQAQDLANDYIKKFPNYQKYMVTKNADYGFSTANSLVNSSSYKTGGLINEQEYKISTGSRNSSYLFNGLSFFTMTESGNQVKIIDPKVANGINSQNKSSALSGVRVTGFVSGEIQLRGNGTRVSPWKFIERNNVRFDYDDTKIKVSPSTTTVSNGGWAKVNVTPTIQYTYVPQTTCGIIENDILTVTGITSDTVCKIETALREYTVNIDARGGTFSDTMHTSLEWDLLEGNTKATKKVIYSNKVGNLPTGDHVSRVGYTFDGVFEDNTAINSNSLIKKDTNLTIRWKGNKYRVTYNTNGGSITPTYVELIYGDPYVGLHTPSKTGYTFKGWYKDSNLSDSSKITDNTTVLDTASDHTIYAKWEANKYTITFDANGGSVSPSTKEVTYDSKYGEMPTPTKSGYTFDGWYKETSFTNKITSADTVKITTDTTLHAKWLQNVALPASSTYCESRTYNGSSQTIVKSAGEGFTWKSGTSQTNAGTHTVTASIKTGYIWADGTLTDKSINCTILKATPTITLDATSGTVIYGKTITFNEKASVAGKFTVTSNNTSKATVTQASSNAISANTNNLVTVSGIGAGSATITVAFTPTDTSNYENAVSKTYSVTISKADTTITLDATSGTTVVDYNITFNEKANVAGKFTVTSSSTGVATVTQASSNAIAANTNNLVTISPKVAGSATITVAFTPTDTANYKNAASKTYTVTVANKATTPTNSLCVARTYNGSAQTLVSSTSGTGYSLSGYSQTNAGEHTITATLTSGYRWSDNTTGTKTFKCTLSPAKLATPTNVAINASGKVTWSAVANASSYQVSLDGGSWSTASSGGKTISTSVGTHTASVRAVGSGNYATGSSGSDSAIISNKVVVSYKKEEQTCNGSYSFGSSYPPSYISGNAASCTSSNISCNASNVGKEKVTCSNYTWTQTIQTCSSSKSGATIGCSSSCPSGYPSVEAHCTKVYTKKVYNCSCPTNCTGNACTCSWSLSSSTGNLGSCTTVSGTCSVLNRKGTKTECSYNWTSSSYKYCYKTTYSYVNSTPNVFSSSCSVQSKPNCTAANVGSSYITGCKVDQWKEVRTPCNGSYSLGATSTSTVGSCSNNTFTCNSSTVGSTYRKCTANYGCGSGKTEISGKCINRT